MGFSRRFPDSRQGETGPGGFLAHVIGYCLVLLEPFEVDMKGTKMYVYKLCKDTTIRIHMEHSF